MTVTQKSVYVKTYGCQMNVYDSDRMRETLKTMGYAETLAPDIEEAFETAATPVFDLAAATVCENLDRGPTVTATLVNGGSLGIVPLVGFEIFDEAGARVGAAPASEQPLAWPDSSVDATVDLADLLPAGAYTLVVTALFGGDSQVDTRLPFTIGGDPLTAAPLCAAVTPTPSPSP